MELQALVLSILLLSILTGSDAKALDQPSACIQECSAGTLDNIFKPGYEYTYSYETTVVSSFHMDSAGDQRATMSIKVPFSIQAFSQCDLSLQLGNNIFMDGSSARTQDEREWRDALTANPLRFVWKDGKMETLCASNEDPAWVVNFKRGILSAMQISEWKNATAVKESDVSGQCEASYQITDKMYGDKLFKKVKDYSKCVNRDRHLLFAYFTPYEVNSPRQNFIHSQQSCEINMAMAGTIIQGVECEEEHVFRPFSTDESGARTKITQRITYETQRRTYTENGPSRYGLRSTTLEFEEEPEQVALNQARASQDAAVLVDQICSTMDTEQYDKVSKLFLSLVTTLRRLDEQGLSEFYNQLDVTCSTWSSSIREMFVDAVPFCGTEACVKFAARMILDDSVNKNIGERWLAGFSFIKNPTTGMLTTLLDLVENQKLSDSSFLAIGNMVHKICVESETNCMRDTDIRNSLEVLNQHLGANCRTSNAETKQKILLTLRAIGNAGYATSMSTLSRCVADEDNEMEIRVAAVQAFRRMSCDSDRSTLLTTLRNENEDSELRIQSYIALMHCPNVQLIADVKKLLEDEKNMQVGSFIWSHLAELMESKDPLKYYIQRMLSGESFRDFNLDPRKYSRFEELAIFSEKLNAGGTVEGSLIWSPKSFIPRSASVNLTVNVFGQAVNLMEFGARVQGVEKYLQEYLEPDAFKKRQARNNVPEPREPELRDIKRQYQTRENKVDEPRGSWYVRVFGNEMLYKNTEMLQSIERGDPSSFLIDFATKLMSEDGYNYHDDSLLMNSIHTLPTGNGMPLEVAFNGSTSVDVHASGRFNFPGIMSKSPEYIVRGKFNPRAAIVITGSMIVNAHIKKSGIATESTALTSATVEGYAKIADDGNTFEFELDSPYEDNVAFKFKHKLLKLQGDEMQDIETNEKRPRMQELDYCTNERLGQRFCFIKRYVTDRYSNGAPANAIFPMDGPLEISAYLEKTDPTITKYTILGTKRNSYSDPEDSIPERLAVQLTLDTPGSRVNRKTTAMVSYDLPKQKFSLSAQQGEKRYLVQGSYKSDASSKTADVSADWDGRNYAMHANFEKTVVDEETEWRTDSYIQLLHKKITAVGGVTLNPGKRANVDLTVTNALPEPIVLKFDLQDKSTKSRDRLAYSGEGKLSILPYINNGFMFDMSVKPKLSNLILSVDYKINDGAKQSVLFHHKRTNLGTKTKTDWNIDHALTSTQFPSLNHKMEVTYQYAEKATKTSIKIGYGTRVEDPRNPYRLEVAQEYTDRGTAATTDIVGLWSMKSPYLNIDHEVNIEHFANDNKMSSKLYGEYYGGDPYNFQALFEKLEPDSDLIHRKIDLQFPTPFGQMHFVDLLHELPENVYTSNSELSLGQSSELRFVQETKLKNLPMSKSIEISVSKGDGSKMLDVSSFNDIELETIYSSINTIEVAGYDPRGLNIRHSRTVGYPTDVSYLVSSVERVGANFKYFPSDTGKRFVMSVNQRHVKERTVTADIGYERTDELLHLFGEINENDRTLMGTKVRYEKQGPKSASLSLDFEQSLSDTPHSTSTTVQANLNEKSGSIQHRFDDKTLNLSMRKITNGVTGELNHNYCDYVNDATFRITTTENAVNCLVNSGRSQAQMVLMKEPDRLQARLVNNNIRDLRKLGVPSTGQVSVSRSASSATVRSVMARVELDEKIFDAQMSLDDTKTTDRNVVLKMKADLQNDIIEQIPSSYHGAVELDLSDPQSRIRVSQDGQSVELSCTQYYPRYVKVQFINDCEYLRGYDVPARVVFNSIYRKSSKKLELSLDYDEKSLRTEGVFTPEHITGMLNNAGFPYLPQQASLEIESSFMTNPRTLDIASVYNDQKYDFHMKLNNGWKKSATSKMPYLKYVGETELDLNVTNNDELKLRYLWRNYMTDTTAGYSELIVQKLWQGRERFLQEERITISDTHYGYYYNREMSGMEAKIIEMNYRPNDEDNCVVEMRHTQDWNLPKQMCLSMETSGDSGHREVAFNADTEYGPRNARMSYEYTNDRVAMGMSHNSEYVEQYAPINLQLSVDVTTGTVGSLTVKYTAGEKSGKAVASFDKSKNEFDLTVHAPDVLSDDVHFTFTYDIEGNSFMLDALCTYSGQTFSSHTDGQVTKSDADSLFVGIPQGKAVFRSSLNLNGKKASTSNLVELTQDYLLIQTLNNQTLTDKLPPKFDFSRKFSFKRGSGSFDLELSSDEWDAPIIITAQMTREGTTLATFTLTHNQDQWTEALPKELFIKLERSSVTNSHTLRFTLGKNSDAKTISTTVRYDLKGSSKFVDLNVINEFTSLKSDYGIPLSMKMHVDWKTLDSKYIANTKFSLDDVTLKESITITLGDTVTVTYTCDQNYFKMMPSNLSFEGSGTVTDSEVSISSTTDYAGLDEPMSVSFKWTRLEGLRFGNFAMSHNLPRLSKIPRALNFRFEPNDDLTNVALNIQADGNSKRMSLNRAMGNNGRIEFQVNHDFDIIEEAGIPKAIDFQMELPSVSLKWGEKSFTVTKDDRSITITQSLAPELPGTVTISCSCDLSSPSKLIDMRATVDSELYQFYLRYDYNFAEGDNSVNFDWRIVSADSVIVDMITKSRLTASSGLLNVTITQSCCEDLPPTSSYYASVHMQGSSGSAEFKINLNEPITLEVTFEKVTDMKYAVHIVHNQDDISGYLPLETHNTAEATWNDAGGEITLTLESPDMTRTVTTGFKKEIQEGNIDLSFYIEHNSDMIESSLMVPKSLKWTMTRDPARFETELDYSYNGEDLSAGISVLIEDDAITMKFDQNMIDSISSSGRRSSSDFPKKMTMRLTREDGLHRSAVSMKFGQKRRYFNAEYRNTNDETGRSMSVDVDHNLNKLLPFDLVSKFNAMLSFNSSAVVANVEYDSNRYGFQIWKKSTDTKKSAALRLILDDNTLRSKGVPGVVVAMGEFSSEGLSSSIEVDQKKMSGSVKLLEEENLYGVEYTFGTNYFGPITLHETWKVMKLSDTKYSFELSGEQTGIEGLPPVYKASVSVESVTDDSTFTFESSHNIPFLKSQSGIPREIRINLQYPINIAEKSFTLAAECHLDNLFFDNSLNFQLTQETDLYRVTMSGKRTEHLWSTSQDDLINYKSDYTIDMRTNLVDFRHTYNEEDRTGQNILSNSATYQLISRKGYYSSDLNINVPSLNEMGVPTSVNCQLILRQDQATLTHRVMVKGEQKQLTVKVTYGRGIRIQINPKPGRQLSFVFDKDTTPQITLSHNLQCKFAEYIPESFTGTWSMDEKEFDFNIDSTMVQFRVRLQSRHFEVSLSQSGTMIIQGTADYDTHPQYEVKGDLSIPLLKINHSVDTAIQFFDPTNGRSTGMFTLLNKDNNQRLQGSAEALLVDSNIRNLHITVSISSTIPSIPVNFGMEYFMDDTQFKFSMSGNAHWLSTTAKVSDKNFLITVNLPQTFLISKISVEGDCSGSTDDEQRSGVALQWNDNKAVIVNTTASIRSRSHRVTFKAQQNVIDCGREMYGEYTMRKSGSQYDINTILRKDDKTLTTTTRYSTTLQPTTTTRKLTVNIIHPFDVKSIPKQFLTTGIVTYGKDLYDSDWKITSGGEDKIILKKLWRRTGNTCHTTIQWKQPNTAFPLMTFDSTIDLEHQEDLIRFSADSKVNSNPVASVRYFWNLPAANSYNQTYSISYGEEKYANEYYYKLEETQSGNKMTIIQKLTAPEGAKFFSFPVPSEQQYNIVLFYRNTNVHFKGRYQSTMMEHPVELDMMYVLQNGNKLFDGSLSLTSNPDVVTQPDFQTKITVDLVAGVTISIKMPSLGMDKSLNVLYTKVNQTVKITYTTAGSRPVVITLNLQKITRRMISVSDSFRTLPQIKLIASTEENGAYIGFQIRDTPYTLHVEYGTEGENKFIRVVTKRRFQELDQIIKMTMSLSNPETIQLQVTANKKLSRVFNMAVTSGHAELKDKVTAISSKVVEFLESLKEVVDDDSDIMKSRINRNIDMWIDTVRTLKSNIISLIDATQMSLTSGITAGEDSAEITIQKTIEIFTTLVEKLKEIVNKPLEQLKQDYMEEIATQILQLIQPALQPVTRLLNQVHAGTLFLELVQEGISKTIVHMDKNIGAVMNAAKRPLAELVYVNDNTFTINIPLTFPVKGLAGPPSMEDITMWVAQSSLAHEVDSKMKLVYKAMDYYYRYRSILNMPLDELIPPFKGHAEMTGFRHFRTFDGQKFDYMSNCESSHVVAHDFRNNEFTVFVTYGETPSVTIRSVDAEGGLHSVVLHKDYSVTDEERRDIPLPSEYGDIIVTRTGDVITVKTALGLTMKCNFISDICTFDVSPFYFAGVAGMAGTFNNELHDDMTGPAVGEIESAEQLGQSWKTPGSCAASNSIQECSSPSRRASRTCAELFENSNSMFYNCFPVEDPAPYMEMCIKDTCRSSLTNTCSAVSAYARRCALRGVNLAVPDNCARCSSASGFDFNPNEQVQVSGADIVFVVEKSGCLRIKKKEYKKLLNNLHTTLNSTLASGNMKYAVVGFGGPGDLAAPHTITLGKDIFMRTDRDLSGSDERTLLGALRRGEKTNEDSDVMSALHYASQLPFRAGASRTIILLTCSSCEESNMVKSSAVRSLLDEQGIVVHQLHQKNIQASRSSKKVYGFSRGQVYSKNSNDNLVRTDLKISGNDLCLPLVDRTGGSVWNSNMINRESTDYIVNEIVNGVNSTPRQDCVCAMTDYSATAKCTAAR